METGSNGLCHTGPAGLLCSFEKFGGNFDGDFTGGIHILDNTISFTSIVYGTVPKKDHSSLKAVARGKVFTVPVVALREDNFPAFMDALEPGESISNVSAGELAPPAQSPEETG